MSNVGDAALNALTVAAAAKLIKLTSRADVLSSDDMLTRMSRLFESSVNTAQRLARRELRARHGGRLKLSSPDRIVGGPYMQRIMTDAIFNVFRISNLMLLGHAPEPLKRELRNRLLAGLTSAITRAYSQELLYQYEQMAPDFDFVFKKRWKSRLAPNTCAMCRALHGTTVGLNESFPVPDGARIYFDLMMPGLHPNCACTIEIVIPVADLLPPRRRR